MFDNLKKWVVEQVLWVEQNMAGKSGAEKRAAVVAKIDDLIPLPWFLEWMDGPLIGWLVDKCCALLNAEAGHDWSGLNMTGAARESLAQGLPDVDAYTRTVEEVAGTAKRTVQKTVEKAAANLEDTGEKLESLFEQYGIDPSAVVEKAVEKATEAAPEAIKTAAATAVKTAATGAQTSDKLSAHFSKKEFACKCCGKYIPCQELIEKLEKFRELCGNKPLNIGSGTRCLKRNKKVGGAMPDEKKGTKGSQHLFGTAADVQKVSGLTVDQMAKLAEQAGFNGIGKYNWGVHVDVRKTPARWDYRK